MRWRLKIAEDMVQEVVWVGEPCVAGLVVAMVVGSRLFIAGGELRLAVVEDDNFIDTEYSAGACNLSC